MKKKSVKRGKGGKKQKKIEIMKILTEEVNPMAIDSVKFQNNNI